MSSAVAGYCSPGCFRRLEKFPSKSAVIEISDAPDVAAAALNPDNLCQDKRNQYRKHREPCGMGDSEAHRRMGGLSLQKHRHIHRDIFHPILPPVILGINQILVHYPAREFGAEFVQ